MRQDISRQFGTGRPVVPLSQALFCPSMGRNQIIYRTRAIISGGLYIFTPFFNAVYIVEWLVIDNLCTKQGNSSIFEPKIRSL